MTSGLLITVFWISAALVIYAYSGYPLALWLLSKISCRNVRNEQILPEISVVVAVRDEAATIARRLHNLLAQDYPASGVEIIVVSDGSTDDTGTIVSAYRDRNVKLVEIGASVGKAAALNRGVELATGEIIVFTDARQQFAQGAVAALAANFSDTRVGCVSGELVLVKDDSSLIQAEMGAYWHYEKWIRKMESSTGSVVGATGAIYAIRRTLYRNLPPGTILDDVLTPLTIVRQGYRCCFDSSAVAYDCFSRDAAQEWRRKVRTLAGNWQLLSLQPDLLLPWRNPCWWRFISHKILRLIVPFALIKLFVSGALLPGAVYRTATALQCLLYATALAGVCIPDLRRMRSVSLCYFFLVMNTAALVGFWCWLTGKSTKLWQPLKASDK